MLVFGGFGVEDSDLRNGSFVVWEFNTTYVDLRSKSNALASKNGELFKTQHKEMLLMTIVLLLPKMGPW
jgi:hypothetical protein